MSLSLNFAFILGADDPEMNTIRAIALDHGYTVAEAMAEGRRVNPGTAYATDAFSGAIPQGAHVVAVECDGPAFDALRDAGAFTVVDHHRPGDPGYGAPPQDYLRGSSLGQVLTLLGVKPTPEHRLVAAADHCLGAAYRGQCPGVDPDALMAWRAASRAAFQRRSADEVLADVRAAMTVIEAAPVVQLGDGAAVRDLRGADVPELPEAAARLGVAVMATPGVRPGDRPKVNVLGGDPPTIRAWMTWAQAQGLADLYGDPERGFAGGYVPA